MAEENATTEGTEEQTNGASGKEKTRAGLARRATRNLRRARTTYESNEWQESNEAEFLLQEATVLALMDLAEAVREQQGDGDKGGDKE